MTTTEPSGVADLGPLNHVKEQKAWYWYDWANSAFYTTVLTVLFSPYLISVAGKAAGCAEDDRTEDACRKTVELFGFIPVAAGSLPFFLTSGATIVSAFLLPVVGAMVDRSPRKKFHMAAFAWAGSFFCALLFFVKDENWQLGAFAIVMASVLAAAR
jgi:UMF1 family MFS transporter